MEHRYLRLAPAQWVVRQIALFHARICSMPVAPRYVFIRRIAIARIAPRLRPFLERRALGFGRRCARYPSVGILHRIVVVRTEHRLTERALTILTRPKI